MRFAESVVPAVLLVAVLGTAQGLAQNTNDARKMINECNAVARDCKKPVQFVSKEGDCVCFTCEYGTPTAKLVCTQSKDEARNLYLKEKGSKADKERYAK